MLNIKKNRLIVNNNAIFCDTYTDFDLFSFR